MSIVDTGSRPAAPQAPTWERVDVPAYSVHGFTSAASSYLVADLGELPGAPGHALTCNAPAPGRAPADADRPELARVTHLGPNPFTRFYLDDPADLDAAKVHTQAAADIAEAEAQGRSMRIQFADGRVIL